MVNVEGFFWITSSFLSHFQYSLNILYMLHKTLKALPALLCIRDRSASPCVIFSDSSSRSVWAWLVFCGGLVVHSQWCSDATQCNYLNCDYQCRLAPQCKESTYNVSSLYVCLCEYSREGEWCEESMCVWSVCRVCMWWCDRGEIEVQHFSWLWLNWKVAHLPTSSD